MSQHFPDGFTWGAATAAYQIEGSPLADGAGESIWHRFAHTPGTIADGTTGDVACDHYRRWPDDIALMQTLGLPAYRLSISWSRLLPDGAGRINQRGIDYYDALIDRLCAAGIAPWVTLYHWDLPAALDERGGWLNRDVAEWFVEYARLCYRTYGDRVASWSTLNEPRIIADRGYLRGGGAPGHRNLFAVPRVAHHLLLAHGAAVQAARSDGIRHIGLVVNIEPREPASDHPDDVAAAARGNAYYNRMFLDPVFKGRYPAALPGIFGIAWRDPDPRDFDIITAPMDYLGVNYYTRVVVTDDPLAPPVRERRVRQDAAPHTTMDWEVDAPGLTRALVEITARYGRIPLAVTENGAAFIDPEPSADDIVEDAHRTQFLHDHVAACHDAIAAGADLRAYFVWSLLDNFEWSHGYAKRFGLVHVDYATQRRVPKRSALYYRDVIRANAVVPLPPSG
jgi:beta-glucosidase